MSELEEKIAGYFRKKKEVIAVYLFGSRAEGKDRELSDIDIGILLDGDSLDFANEKRKEYAAALGRSTRKDIDAVILNSEGRYFRKANASWSTIRGNWPGPKWSCLPR